MADQRSGHRRKLIAPVVVTIVLALYLLGFSAACLALDFPAAVKIIGLPVSLGLLATAVYVLVERIKEIRSGEEDDLSQY